MSTALVIAALVVPILVGGAVHYVALKALRGRRVMLAATMGWVATFAAAALLFPRWWLDMEYLTCGLVIGDVLVQTLLNVTCQPLARRLARRA